MWRKSVICGEGDQCRLLSRCGKFIRLVFQWKLTSNKYIGIMRPVLDVWLPINNLAINHVNSTNGKFVRLFLFLNLSVNLYMVTYLYPPAGWSVHHLVRFMFWWNESIYTYSITSGSSITLSLLWGGQHYWQSLEIIIINYAKIYRFFFYTV